jgi:hypothetical protein
VLTDGEVGNALAKCCNAACELVRGNSALARIAGFVVCVGIPSEFSADGTGSGDADKNFTAARLGLGDGGFH